MKRKIVIILLAVLPAIGFCQNKYYHLLDYTCASCTPPVLLWNVNKTQAIEFGDYVEEYTDSLQRVTKLLLYTNNKNRRAVIDDWDYVIYEYTDSTIVAIELVSPLWWYPIDTVDYSSDFLYGPPVAELHTIKYDSKSTHHEIISSTYQTIRGWEYYAAQLVDCNYYATYEQAYEYVKSHFVYTEEPDTSNVRYDDPLMAYVRLYSYSIYKNGIGQVEPMGVTMRANRVY